MKGPHPTCRLLPEIQQLGTGGLLLIDYVSAPDATGHGASGSWSNGVRSILTLTVIRKIGELCEAGLGATRRVVDRANAWLLANRRLGRRIDRLAMIIDALL
jgi:hypothetical protein